MRLLLVRHGESICGVNGVVGGMRGCTGLTDLGRTQATALRDRFARAGEVDSATVLSSPLQRAVQTAEILAPALGAADVTALEDLREFDPGEADGLTWDRWREVHGEFDPLNEPDRPMAPGAESWNVFRARIEALLDRLAAERDGETVIAACHGGVIFMSLIGLLGIEPGRVALYPDFTSVTEWSRDDGRWMLARYNDAAHLHELERESSPQAG